MTKLEQEIYNILILHVNQCDFHRKLWETFKPFVFIHTENKAKDLANFIKDLKRRKDKHLV